MKVFKPSDTTARRPAGPWRYLAVLGILLGLRVSTCLAAMPPRSAATSVFAHAGQSDPSQRHRAFFLIEAIDVEGAKLLSPSTILATARLEADQGYDETELRAAVARLLRLPLVLDANVSLARGSERGRYRLILRVEEVEPWFFGLQAESAWWSHEVSVDGLSTTRRVDEGRIFGGRRFPVGRRSVAFAVASADGELSAGYSRYDLFGRGGVATFSLSTVRCDDVRRQAQEAVDVVTGGGGETVDVGTECRTAILDLLDPSAASWSAGERTSRFRLELVLPLVGQHRLQLRADARTSDSGIRRPVSTPTVDTTLGFDDRTDQGLELAWIRDSLDDPVFPTAGSYWQAGLAFQHVQASLAPILPDSPETSPPWEMESTLYGASTRAEIHRPVSPRNSLSVGGWAFTGRRDARNVPVEEPTAFSDSSAIWRFEFSLGHSLRLRRSLPGAPFRELRWTSDLDLFDGSSFTPGLPAHFERGFRIGSGLSWRTDWGLVSLRLAYIDRGDG